MVKVCLIGFNWLFNWTQKILAQRSQEVRRNKDEITTILAQSGYYEKLYLSKNELKPLASDMGM